MWTDAQIKALTKLCASGKILTASEIAQKIGVTRNAIIGKVRRLGLKLPQSGSKSQKPRQRLTVKVAPKPSGPPPVSAVQTPVYVPHEGARLTMETVGGEQCRFPFGDPASPDFHLCGNDGFPWCEYHKRIVFTQAPRND